MQSERHSLLDSPSPEESLPTASQKQMPARMCEEGRDLLKQQQYFQASKCFSKSVLSFEFLLKNQLLSRDQIKTTMKQTVLPAYSNLSLCHLKLQNYHSVLKLTEHILQNDSSNAKARYRRGIAYQMLKEYDQAVQEFECLSKQHFPMQDEAKQLIIDCKRLKKQQREQERNIASQMLNGGRKENQTNSTKKLLTAKCEPPFRKQQINLLQKIVDCLRNTFIKKKQRRA